jgi:hypothetical protein
MTATQTLLEEVSPLGNVQAVVEDDGRAVYFYLNYESPPKGTSPTRACWVINRVAARLRSTRMHCSEGSALMPATHCRNPGPAVPESGNPASGLV